MSKPTIFISYSHKDADWKDRLVTHLGVLQYQNLLEFWTDDEIRIGETWLQKIQDAMNSASVAILLVSAHSLTSSFILRKEIKRLLERRDGEGLSIFPILVRPCAWRLVPWLMQMQLRPRNGIPLSAGTEYQIDENLTSIVEEINAALEQVVLRTTPEPQPVTVEVGEPPQKQTTHSLEAGLEVPTVPAPTSLAPTFSNSIGMELILIPAGEFRMGAEDGGDDEKPVHLVRISRPFYMGKDLVTQAQWEAVMGTNPSRFTDDPTLPVENVSWDDAQEFLRRLSEKGGGEPYRLPTEAEWEYAARAGAATSYCFGDEPSRLQEYAWYGENSGGRTHPVGKLKPNAWGLYDVHGNVWEWVQDWYDAGYYQRSLAEDPRGPEEGQYRVVRGGSGFNGPRGVRVSSRLGVDPGARDANIGFRCAQ
ncbi:MAG: SUMF1/EgtB/PvdO family nonheme iron enzyme [Deltaproteobacteria bacterium]|nr:SUMF1/EgtB/PvdO family nonheme iron enzyme [Deltaproteobacteria bacterium]